MSDFRKVVSMGAVLVLGVTNFIAPLSYATAENLGDFGSITFPLETPTARSFSFVMPNHHVSLRAETAANTYKVHYDGNNETSGTMPDKTFTYNITGSLDENQFVKTGYAFDTWNTQSNGSGTRYSDQAQVINWTATDGATIPIYAQWNAKEYNIIYHMNDEGSSSGEFVGSHPTSLQYDQTGTIDNPERLGYDFVGWDITDMDTESHIVGGEASNSNSATAVTGTIFKNLRADTGDVNFVATWDPTLTDYIVNHYRENIGGGYPETPYQTGLYQGLTDSIVTGETATYEGFETPLKQSTGVKADGTTKFDYYYTRNKYTVTLNAGRGIASVSGAGTSTPEESANDTVDIDFWYWEQVTLDSAVKQGYQNPQWSGSNDNESSFNMPAEDIVKTAYATPIVYTINADPKGGTVSPANPTSYTVESGDITLTNPNRADSDFVGWTGTDEPVANTGVTIASGSIGNRSYTAVWTCHDGFHPHVNGESCIEDEDTPYTVRHVLQSLTGGYTIFNDSENDYKTGKTNTETVAVAKHYTGFEVANVGTGIIRGDGNTVVDVKYHRLSFNSQIDEVAGIIDSSADGLYSEDEPSIKYGDTVTLSATKEEGYTFNSWTVRDASGVSVPVNNASSLTNATFEMPASAVTITPNLTPIEYTISYQLNSGHYKTGETNRETYTVEDNFTLNNPERDHSVFLGWSGTGISGTSGSVTINGLIGNRSYEAVWDCDTGYHPEGNSCEPNQYSGSVNYNYPGEEHGTAAEISFTYDEFTTLDNPEDSGYNFVGWNIYGMSGGVEHYIGTITTVTGSEYTGTLETQFKNLSTAEGMTDIRFEAQWSPKNDTPFVVYHYLKNPGTDTYVLDDTVYSSGTTDTEIDFVNDVVKDTYTGFEYSGGYLTGGTTRPTEGAVTTGNIDKHGTTEIHLYYDRIKYTVTLNGDEHVATLTGAGTYEYGENVSVSMTPETGYHFVRWRKVE